MFRLFATLPYLVLAGRPDMSIFRFIKWIDEGVPIEMFGDGSQSRDFTYVNDIAMGYCCRAFKDVGYEIINLGGGRNPVSLNTIIEKIEALVDKRAKIDHKPFHIADLTETRADIDKAKNLLGWEPKVSLDEGLEKSVSWYIQKSRLVEGIAGMSIIPQIALVGCGYWGKNLCRNFNALGSLSTVVDATKDGQESARSIAP